MREKAIKDLAQLSDPELFLQVAEGLERILKNAQNFHDDSKRLAFQLRGPSSRTLRTIAEEEAAKYLILIDAIRCQRGSPDFSRQLSWFLDHLARGIYAYSTFGQYPTFGDLRHCVDEERKSRFLDGPQGDDYIYRNGILQRRESMMYVDYEENDGEHTWSAPLHGYGGITSLPPTVVPPALETAVALDKAGFTTSQGLDLLSRLWRPVTMVDEFTRSELGERILETCKAADAEKLPGVRDRDIIDGLIKHWQYPMHSLELKMIRVDESALRNRQGASWLAEDRKSVVTGAS